MGIVQVYKRIKNLITRPAVRLAIIAVEMNESCFIFNQF